LGAWLIWAFVVAWVTLVVAGYLRWTLSTEANHGRHLFAALGSLAVLVVAGWAALLPRRWGAAGPAALAATLLAFSLAAPFRYVTPAHAAAPLLAAGERPGGGWREVGVTYGGALRLAAARGPRPAVRAGDWLELELLWEAVAPMGRDYSLFLHLDRPDGTRV